MKHWLFAAYSKCWQCRWVLSIQFRDINILENAELHIFDLVQLAQVCLLPFFFCIISLLHIASTKDQICILIQSQILLANEQFHTN